MKKKIYAAYHTHAQGSMTAFDEAFALSKGNMANVDFGHWVAAGNIGGTPIQFLKKYHDRIVELPPQGPNAAGELLAESPWGTGRRDQGHPADGQEEQVGDSLRRSSSSPTCQKVGRGEGNEEVRRVLSRGTDGAHLNGRYRHRSSTEGEEGHDPSSLSCIGGLFCDRNVRRTAWQPRRCGPLPLIARFVTDH